MGITACWHLICISPYLPFDSWRQNCRVLRRQKGSLHDVWPFLFGEDALLCRPVVEILPFFKSALVSLFLHSTILSLAVRAVMWVKYSNLNSALPCILQGPILGRSARLLKVVESRHVYRQLRVYRYTGIRHFISTGKCSVLKQWSLLYTQKNLESRISIKVRNISTLLFTLLQCSNYSVNKHVYRNRTIHHREC